MRCALQATDAELQMLQGFFRDICEAVLSQPGAAGEVVVARSGAPPAAAARRPACAPSVCHTHRESLSTRYSFAMNASQFIFFSSRLPPHPCQPLSRALHDEASSEGDPRRSAQHHLRLLKLRREIALLPI